MGQTRRDVLAECFLSGGSHRLHSGRRHIFNASWSVATAVPKYVYSGLVTTIRGPFMAALREIHGTLGVPSTSRPWRD